MKRHCRLCTSFLWNVSPSQSWYSSPCRDIATEEVNYAVTVVPFYLDELFVKFENFLPRKLFLLLILICRPLIIRWYINGVSRFCCRSGLRSEMENCLWMFLSPNFSARILCLSFKNILQRRCGGGEEQDGSEHGSEDTEVCINLSCSVESEPLCEMVSEWTSIRHSRSTVMLLRSSYRGQTESERSKRGVF